MLTSFGLITGETLGLCLQGEAHYFTLKQRIIDGFQMRGNYLFASLPHVHSPAQGTCCLGEKPSHKKNILPNYVAERQRLNKTPMKTIPPVISRNKIEAV